MLRAFLAAGALACVRATMTTSCVQERGGAQVCVLSCVYRGSLCSVRSGSVCARCLWVILSGYNKPLLRVNVVRWQLWVIVIADCGRLLLAARAAGERFEFPTLYHGVGRWMLRYARRRIVKTRHIQLKTRLGGHKLGIQ